MEKDAQLAENKYHQNPLCSNVNFDTQGVRINLFFMFHWASVYKMFVHLLPHHIFTATTDWYKLQNSAQLNQIPYFLQIIN